MPKHANGKSMVQAIDEKSGQFDKDGFERSYSLELLDANGNSLKKIFWNDLAPVVSGMAGNLSIHGINTSDT